MPSSSFLLGLGAVLSTLSSTAFATKYQVQDSYNGANWLDAFKFETYEKNNGFVDYVDEATAESMNLYRTVGTDVLFGADSSETLNSADGGDKGRKSVRLEGKKNYNHGLFVIDVKAMPSVCGMWSSFWSLGQEPWPVKGEIDIIEGVNQNTNNKYVLHTDTQCKTDGLGQTGEQNLYDCSIDSTSGTSGCDVNESRDNSFGGGFNANGGGIYAMEWDSDAIRTWFFPRGSTIPASLTYGEPDTSDFGTPAANFEGDCDIDQRFKDHRFIFTNNFCGDWAGNVYAQSSCPKYTDANGVALDGMSSCKKYVAENPQDFEDAYWRISSFKTYQKKSVSSSSSSVAHSSTRASSSTVRSASSTPVRSSSVRSSSVRPSSTPASSAPVRSSSIHSSSVPASSTPIRSSSLYSSSIPVRSSSVRSSSIRSSSIQESSTPIRSSSVHTSSSAVRISSVRSSNIYATSTPVSSSSIHVSSTPVHGSSIRTSSSIHAPSSVHVSSSVYSASSSVHVAASSSIPYSARSATLVASSSIHYTISSQAASGSALASASASASVHVSLSSSVVYSAPSTHDSSVVYPSSASSEAAYAVSSSISNYAAGNNSTSLSSGTGYHASSTTCTTSSTKVGYETSAYPLSSALAYPVYPDSESSASAYGGYPAQPSKLVHDDYDYLPDFTLVSPIYPDVTSKPSYGNGYDSHPEGSKTAITTTYTTTYVDVCETGYTTITTEHIVTYNPATTPAAYPTSGSDYSAYPPPGFEITTKVCNKGCGEGPTTVTVTIPKEYPTEETGKLTTAIPTYPTQPACIGDDCEGEVGQTITTKVYQTKVITLSMVAVPESEYYAQHPSSAVYSENTPSKPTDGGYKPVETPSGEKPGKPVQPSTGYPATNATISYGTGYVKPSATETGYGTAEFTGAASGLHRSGVVAAVVAFAAFVM